MKKTNSMFIFFLMASFLSLSIVAQNRQPDSLIYEDDGLTSLHKRISIGASAGKRSSDLSIKMGLQLLTYINWKKFDLGLGVNYENENYFNLIPAYAHLAYALLAQKNPAKIFLQPGLAFNVPQSANYDYGKPGIMLGFGIEQAFNLFKRLSSSFQIMYRFQETSTVREWQVFHQPHQTNTNSEVIRHRMHRLMLVFGVNF